VDAKAKDLLRYSSGTTNQHRSFWLPLGCSGADSSPHGTWLEGMRTIQVRLGMAHREEVGRF
jgi:hypothetical protein